MVLIAVRHLIDINHSTRHVNSNAPFTDGHTVTSLNDLLCKQGSHITKAYISASHSPLMGEKTLPTWKHGGQEETEDIWR